MSAGKVRLARTSDGELFVSVTAHGTFKVPSHTAHSSSPYTQLASTWGFVERAGRFLEIGELARGPEHQLAQGHGVPVIVNDDGSLLVCKTGAHAVLPASPHARSRQLLTLRVDGGIVIAVYAEHRPRPATCTRLAHGVTLSRLFVDRIDIDAQAPTWSTVTTRPIAATPGKGCRTAMAASAAVAPGGAAIAIAIQSGTVIDGGDYVSSADTSLSLESWSAGRWETSTLAASFQRPSRVVVAVDKDGASLALQDENLSRFRVYRRNGASLVAQGSESGGVPLVLSASGVVSTDAMGMLLGSMGVGYRFQAHALTGDAWSAITDPVSVTAVHGASALLEASEIVAGTADTADNQGPIVARIFRTEGRGWRPLPTFEVRPSM